MTAFYKFKIFLLSKDICIILIEKIKIKEKKKKIINKFYLANYLIFLIFYFFYLFLNNLQNKNLFGLYFYFF